jgi:hypothetical protein
VRGLLLLLPQAAALGLLVAVACPIQAAAWAPHQGALLGLLLLLRALLLGVAHGVP